MCAGLKQNLLSAQCNDMHMCFVLLTVKDGVEGLCLPVAEQPKLRALDTNCILRVWSSTFGTNFIKDGNEETKRKQTLI